MINIKNEFELYLPMKEWLQRYLEDKYKEFNIITVDAHAERLDKILSSLNISNSLAIGIDIQIDILGVAQNATSTKLFFIEAKKGNLTLRDLGQLWAYCKLIDPEEAFLMTSGGLGSLNKIFNTFHREDLLSFGNLKHSKKMKICQWNLSTNAPIFESMIPKI